MDIQIINISQIQGENLDYNKYIFKFKTGSSIDIERSKDVKVFLTTLIQGGALKFIIDMSDLAAIDSTGMGELINIAKLLRSKRGDIVFLNVSEEIKKIFDIISLQKFIKILYTEAEAVKFFRYV